jgi:hypothetical protein
MIISFLCQNSSDTLSAQSKGKLVNSQTAPSFHTADLLIVRADDRLFSFASSELIADSSFAGFELQSIDLVAIPHMNLSDPFIIMALEAEILASIASDFRSFLVLASLHGLEDELELVDTAVAFAFDSSQSIVAVRIFKGLSLRSSADIGPAFFSLFVNQVMTCFFNKIGCLLKHFF